MTTHAHAQSVCEQYVSALVEGNLEGVLGLFDDAATVEDPVGSGVKGGRETLAEFYQVACQSVTAGHLTGAIRVAGDEVAFPFQITIAMGEQPMTIDIIDVFRFGDDGKVVSMRAFWGRENMAPAT